MKSVCKFLGKVKNGVLFEGFCLSKFSKKLRNLGFDLLPPFRIKSTNFAILMVSFNRVMTKEYLGVQILAFFSAHQ